MVDKDLGQKVLDTIKDKHIKPKSHWEFLIKDSAVWILFGLSIFVGSLASSVIIFLLRHDPSSTALAIHPLKDLMLKIPYFWIIILLMFLLVSFYNAKHTKHGYRYNSYLIILISILLSLIAGIGIYMTRGAEKIENSFYHKVPGYRQITDQRGKMFINPEDGMIAGHIISIKDDIIHIQCFDKKVWTVVLPSDISFDVATGMRLRIMGELLDEEHFEADEFIPWFRSGHFERKNYQPAY
jgi:hypothetical protein